MTVSGIRFPLHVDVPLRQHRSYLHSTNLFDFLVKKTGGRKNLMLTFRRQIVSESDVVPASEVPDPGQCSARFAAQTDAQAIELVLVEQIPRIPLSRREAYDEDAAIAGSRLEESSIFSDRNNGATPIERIVALNKRLLTKMVQSRRVLLFSSIRLAAIPRSEAELQICLRSRLGQTLFRSAIIVDGTEGGEIVFYGT